jgi:hypothetical protein
MSTDALFNFRIVSIIFDWCLKAMNKTESVLNRPKSNFTDQNFVSFTVESLMQGNPILFSHKS